MTDPAELLASQAEEIANSDTIPVLRMAQILALWGEALTAVLDLHKPHPEMPPDSTWCMHCLDDNLGPQWPCPTVQAITTALEAT